MAEMRNDRLYRRNGDLHIPTVREAMDFVFNDSVRDQESVGTSLTLGP